MLDQENVNTDDRFDWVRVRKKESNALATAEKEAKELARIVAAQTMVVEKDAVIAEFQEREQTLASTLWSDDPLDGFQMFSSLGAYLLARVAVGWVPSGHTGLRHEPLRPEALKASLVEQGVDETTAASVLGDWTGATPGFRRIPGGLSVSSLAGLAERSLMRHERHEALSQVAYSPRCLLRLAATCNLVASVRVLMPCVPSSDLGPEVVSSLAALALGRPRRVIDLLGEAPQPLALKTLVEIAEALMAFEQGALPSLERSSAGGSADETISMPREDEDTARAADDDEDDVLDIVEERLESGHFGVHGALPVLTAWDPNVTPIDPFTLDSWSAALDSLSSLAAVRGALLGLKLPPASEAVWNRPLTPDAKTLRNCLERIGGRDHLANALSKPGMGLLGSPLEALFPPVRGVLRLIVRASEGFAPSMNIVSASGDYAWIIRRARALALVVKGDLQGAREAVSTLSITAAPEGRWAADRAHRFGDHPPEAVSPIEARSVAGLLVADLAHQLARTLTGTIPRGVT